jgi:carboxylesterase type B
MPSRNPQNPAPGEPDKKPATDAEVAGIGQDLSAGTTPAFAADQDESIDALRERIRQLEAQNEKLEAAKDIAEEESARLSAQAQSSLLTSSVVERFAGKADDGTDLWYYRIDMAPCGGTELRINGRPYLHGETYKFDTDTLRTVKEMVARTWVHENDINGHAFNPYRQAQNRVLGNPGAVPSWARQ